MLFSTKANLYCHTNSLGMKHGDAPKLKNVLASIVTSLLHLTMINTNKHGVGFEDRLRPFSLYDASRSSLMIRTEIGHAHFLTPLVVDWL